MVSLDFKQLVYSGDIKKIKMYLIDTLMYDRSFNKFYEYLNYAEEYMNIIEEHDGTTFEENKDKWNIRYLNSQKNKLMENFSGKRIDHIKNVINILFPFGKENFNSNRNKLKYSRKINRNNNDLFDFKKDRSEYGERRKKSGQQILNEDGSDNLSINKNYRNDELEPKKDRSEYGEKRQKSGQQILNEDDSDNLSIDKSYVNEEIKATIGKSSRSRSGFSTNRQKQGRKVIGGETIVEIEDGKKD